MFTVGKISHQWSKESRLESIYQESLPSTNDLGKEIALTSLSQSPISLILTDLQTQGRGRSKNTWISPEPGTSLLSTWVFQVTSPPQPVTTCRIGLAVFNSLVSTWPWLEISLKAPNDIYLKNKKIGGLLAEVVSQGPKQALVIGLGLNVFSNPELETADFLCSTLNHNQITEEDWTFFLDRLLLELSLAISASAKTLNERERHAILVALNKKPDLKEKYIDLSPEGNLKTPSHTLNWQTL